MSPRCILSQQRPVTTKRGKRFMNRQESMGHPYLPRASVNDIYPRICINAVIQRTRKPYLFSVFVNMHMVSLLPVYVCRRMGLGSLYDVRAMGVPQEKSYYRVVKTSVVSRECNHYYGNMGLGYRWALTIVFRLLVRQLQLIVQSMTPHFNHRSVETQVHARLRWPHQRSSSVMME